MKNFKKTKIKRLVDGEKAAIRENVDAFVRQESHEIYGQPISIPKRGRIIKGKSPNFKMVDKIERVRKKL